MTIFPIYKLREIPEDVLKHILDRSKMDISRVEADVRRIIEDVKARGDEAIAEFLSSQVGRTVKPEEIVVREEDVGRA